MKISVIIPAYNEEGGIKNTVAELLEVLSTLQGMENTEIIIVDDHSSDGTFNIIKSVNDERIKCLRLSRRSGSHVAMRAGLHESTGDVALCISADGQDNPACIKDMLGKWKKGATVIWALRKDRHGEHFHMRWPAQLFYNLLIWLGSSERNNIDISRANFFLLDRKVVNAINMCMERNTSLFGVISWLGFNQDFVEYDRRVREFGKSKWNFVNNLRLAKDWIVGFSGLPLTLIFIIGILVTGASFFYGIFILIKYLSGNIIQNYSLTMLLILLLGGIQMIMLGVIGEYLWNNLVEARKRPLFLIEKRSK